MGIIGIFFLGLSLDSGPVGKKCSAYLHLITAILQTATTKKQLVGYDLAREHYEKATGEVRSSR